MDYQVELDTFRGPLDLLLYLVKKEEVDVLDIPIARIVEQYLRYLEVIQLVDVEAAGDFIVMASTLMEIKSRMLLPRQPAEADEEDDPRRELVRQLLQYQKFKEAAALLEERAAAQARCFARQTPPETGEPAPRSIQPVEIWDLVSAFSRLMRETLATPTSNIANDDTPIQDYVANVLEQLERTPRARFVDLFTPPLTRARLVGLFLAMLELIKSHRVTAEQDGPFGDIWLSLLPAAAPTSAAHH